jgi:hypothetical protein
MSLGKTQEPHRLRGLIDEIIKAETQAPFHYENADIVDIRSSLSEERFASLPNGGEGQ